jgi:hypothetical protein
MTTQLVSSWRCLVCPESGEGTAKECDKAAEKHVKATGHGTLTGTQPRGNK